MKFIGQGFQKLQPKQTDPKKHYHNMFTDDNMHNQIIQNLPKCDFTLRLGICYHKFTCLSSVCLSSVTFTHPTQEV